MNITKLEAAELIRNSNGRFFSVGFTKRSTGEKRQMNCRTGVTSHLKGGTAAYSFKDAGVVSVYDVENNGYRCIPIEGISSLTINNSTYTVC